MRADSEQAEKIAKLNKGRLLVDGGSEAIFSGAVPPLLALMLWYGTWLSTVDAYGTVSYSGNYDNDADCTGGFQFGAHVVESFMVPLLVVFTGAGMLGQTLSDLVRLL